MELVAFGVAVALVAAAVLLVVGVVALIRGHWLFAVTRFDASVWIGLAVVLVMVARLGMNPSAKNQTPIEVKIAEKAFRTQDKDNKIVSQWTEDGTVHVVHRYFPAIDSRREVFMVFTNFARDVFARVPEARGVSVTTWLPFDDAYGNTTWRKMFTIEMSRDTAAKINWDSFLSTNLPKVADSYWEGP